MAKKTVIAPMQPTPLWAKIVFRVVLYLSAGVGIWLYQTTLVGPEAKAEINLIMTAFVVPGIHLLSKMFGLVEK